MKIFDSLSFGSNFLEYLSKREFRKKDVYSSEIQIKRINEKEDYAGYADQNNSFISDILFTKTILKDMKPFISDSFVKLMLSMAENDFSKGKKLREQEEMKSVVIPGTKGQKVLEFCALRLKEWKRQAYILIGVGESLQWNYHGNSLSHKNGFAQKARQRQKYYDSIYRTALLLAQ